VYGLMHAAAFRPILNQLGFDALELVICGGAPMPPETIALWQIWGVNVCEIYGQTETAGAIITGQKGPFPRPGDVGTAPSGWHIGLGAGNEILVSGDDLFEGYWGDDAATSQVFDAAGQAAHRRRGRIEGRTAAHRRPGARLPSPPAARRSRPPTSRISCAPRPTSARWWCSATRKFSPRSSK
jgi:acyl-CoA synthetase (AMP-forming)/AMP-acid ligase II